MAGRFCAVVGRRAFLLAIVYCVLLPRLALGDEVLEALKEELEDPTQIDSVLRKYNRIESGRRYDDGRRLSIHRGLVTALRGIKHPEILSATEAWLKKSDKLSFPAQVVLMKVLRGNRFPASKARRAGLLMQAARSQNERLSIWAVRTLGDSKWKQSVDGLIALLRLEERAGNFDSLLFESASLELYRVLGTAAAHSGSGKIQKNWEAMRKQVPSVPDHGLWGGSGASVFFGDKVAPRSVFCIDTSSSMRQLVTIKKEYHRPRSGRTKVGTKEEKEGTPSNQARKVDIVKGELVQALGGLRATHRFNVISYNADADIWRGSRLLAARPSTVRTATRFVEKLETHSGTNIFDALVKAIAMDGVETIYLLSDGAPSRGGGPSEIEARVAEMNYLRGVRIITYGISPDGVGSYNEEFMKQLAGGNWGWYRKLN